MSQIIFNIITTPNPTEIGISIEVQDSLLSSNPQLFPSQDGTISYKDFVGATAGIIKLDQAWVKGFGDYVYTYPEKGRNPSPSTEGTTILYFAKKKTDAQRNTPFKTWFTKKDWTFDAVLHGVQILQYLDPDTGRLTYFPKYFEQDQYVGPCLFKIEQFLSEVPWNANTFTAIAPQTGTVDCTLVGPNGFSLHIFRSRVLHPQLVFNNPWPLDTTLLYKTGEVPIENGENLRYIFSATRPAGRLSYIQADGQNPTQGQYLRERVTVYPPFASTPLNER